MEVAVLADTHIPKRAKSLPEKALKLLSTAQVIVHAGDILTEEFLQSLRDIARVYAVKGNNDLTLSLPETMEFEIEGAKIALIHDSGNSNGRASRMRKRFPASDIVIFGHSHIPMNIMDNGQRLFNPGSATNKRQQRHHTMGRLVIENGIVQADIIELD